MCLPRELTVAETESGTAGAASLNVGQRGLAGQEVREVTDVPNRVEGK